MSMLHCTKFFQKYDFQGMQRSFYILAVQMYIYYCMLNDSVCTVEGHLIERCRDSNSKFITSFDTLPAAGTSSCPLP